MVALAHVPANAAWAPNPGPQTAFLASPCREVGYGGAAGGGKSDGLLAAAGRYIDNPKHNAVIFRRSFPEFSKLIRRSLEVYGPLGARYNQTQHTWSFPSGAAIHFRSIDDITKRQGDDFTFIGWDELTQLPADAENAAGEPINSDYQFMISRLRQDVGTGIRLQIRATFNPGGPGHLWTKNYFRINDAGEATHFKNPMNGYHRAFIPARIKDNPHLAGTEYERNLDMLPELMRKALRDGRWDIFDGAKFQEWNPRCGEIGSHVIEPYHIPSDWVRWRGSDDGFAAPAACYWFAKHPDTGQFVIYQELYRKGMQPDVFADEVKRMDREQPVADPSDPDPQDGLEGIMDSAAFSNNGQSEISRGHAMNKLGCRWKEAEKGNGSRVLRVKAMHARLAPMKHDPLKRPGIVFFKNCKHAIRTIPALPISQNNPEDVDTEADDHPFDGLTYGFQYRSTSLRRVAVSGF